ncbi:MAG: TolC family protein, partial [Gammaproteobacteria bacterium]|nr:TolC family protein [Gammaproteobacteria bacterium]
LSLKSFVELVTRNDTVFEEILIDTLKIKYRRDIGLPVDDIILSVKATHNYYLDQDRNDPELTMGLSRLFQDTGTDVSLSYAHSSSATSSTADSSLQFLISQPIAENAFGRGTRLLDQIIGLENDVIRYQVVEAYEDYLASLTAIYYNWYSAFENMKVGQASYNSNMKLMDNIHERQRQNIALPIDVNKMELLVIGKKENLIALRENFANITNLVKKAIRADMAVNVVPVNPSFERRHDLVFDRDYQQFTANSRTYRMLSLLENKGVLNMQKTADDLLPSTNLLLGYKIEGSDWGINNNNDKVFAGISVTWPLGNKVDKAKHELARIDHKKTVLSNKNKYEDLRTSLNNIYLQVDREKALIDIAKRKIVLAEAVLTDEAENYSFGKVSLNDYIDAVNRVDESHFNKILHTVQLNKLLVEWLRLTDKLVDESVLDKTKSIN